MIKYLSNILYQSSYPRSFRLYTSILPFISALSSLLFSSQYTHAQTPKKDTTTQLSQHTTSSFLLHDSLLISRIQSAFQTLTLPSLDSLDKELLAEHLGKYLEKTFGVPLQNIFIKRINSIHQPAATFISTFYKESYRQSNKLSLIIKEISYVPQSNKLVIVIDYIYLPKKQ